MFDFIKKKRLKGDLKSLRILYADLKSLSKKFRDWNREWFLFDKGYSTKKPKTEDEFLEEIIKEFTIFKK